MARVLTDDVLITVHDDQVRTVIYRLEMATMVSGMSLWANSTVDQWLQARAATRFGGEGDSASGRWKPLSELTNEWRALQGYPEEHPINERSGAFRQWLTHEADGTFMPMGMSAGTYYWPGVHLPYDDYITAKLKVSQVGSKPGENKLFPGSSTPARPVVKVNAVDVLALLTSYHDFIQAYVGDDAGSITASGTFGGRTMAAPSSVRGSLRSGGGGNFA
jgi:hypothetical protein